MTGEYSSHHRRWNEVKVHVVVDGRKLESSHSRGRREVTSQRGR